MFLLKGVNPLDVTILTQLIGSLGFPIAMCLAMMWQLNKTNEQHKAEMDKLSEALNNNTLALTKLATKIGEDT